MENSLTHNICTVAQLQLAKTQTAHLKIMYTPWPVYCYLTAFSMITQGLRNFSYKVSGDITKLTRACTAAQGNTSKLIENAILQALTKPKDVTPPNPTIDSRPFSKTCISNFYNETNCTSSSQTNNFSIPQQSLVRCVIHRDLMKHLHTCHAYVNQQPPNSNSFHINQFVVELFRCQTKVTYSNQWLHQQTTDPLENIAKSSSFQENQYFINDLPIFKVKDSQSSDDWLEQIPKVASLTNKDVHKLSCTKSQGSFSRMISSFPPTMEWNKFEEWLHFNFCSVATKHCVVSVLIDQW